MPVSAAYKKACIILAQNVEKFLSECGITAIEWDTKAGLRRGTVADIKRGRKPRSNRITQKLADAFGLNHHWLLTGEGPQYLPHHEKTSEASTSNIKEDVQEYTRDTGEACVMEDDVAVIDSAVGMFRNSDSAMRDVPRGARIFVDTSADPEDGDLVAVTYQGRVVARRLVQAAGERLLMPDDRKIAEPIREVDAKIHGLIIDVRHHPVRRVTE